MFDNEFKQTTLEEIEKIKYNINAGDATSENYYDLFVHLQILSYENKKLKLERDTCADNVIKAGLKEIHENNIQEYTFICMAQVYEYKKDDKKALYYYNRAIENFPNLANFYFLRGVFYLRRNKKQLAEIDLTKALELDEKLAEGIELIKSSIETNSEINKYIFNIILIILGVIVYLIIKIL